MLDPRVIPKLAALCRQYYDTGEFIDLARAFGVTFQAGEWPLQPESPQEWLSFAGQIAEQFDHGNTRVFLETLLEQLDVRNANAIAATDWERRVPHETLAPFLRECREALDAAGAPGELAIPAASPFAAKSHVREFMEQATTDILVVDPYVGVATLDCFRLVHTPIRLLTAESPTAIGARFGAALAEFQAEGFTIEVRRAPMLHDRHLSFNGRCWLVGSSLKDAGKKAFNCMEILDSKAVVLADLEARWEAAAPYP